MIKLSYCPKQFDDCVKALNTEPLASEESQKATRLLNTLYPFTWSKIDWQKIEKKIVVGYDNPEDILPALCQLIGSDFNRTVYIDWDTTYPVLKTHLDHVLEHYTTVIRTSLDKFIFNPEEGYIIEITSGGLITVGVVLVPQKMSIQFREYIERWGFRIDEAEKKVVQKKFLSTFPMLDTKVIDWNAIHRKLLIPEYGHNNLPLMMKSLVRSPFFDHTLYIQVDGDIFKISLEILTTFLKNIRTILFNAMLFNPYTGYLMELKDDGSILLGLTCPIKDAPLILWRKKLIYALVACVNKARIASDV